MGIMLFVISLNVNYHLKERINSMGFYENEYVSSNGLLFALFSEYINSKPSIPNGYKPGLSNVILSEYMEQPGDANAAPDQIYVIMNESFADFSMLGELKFNEDPLENIHGLTGSYAYGMCAASVFGGYTCNSEYEFLTGESMLFIPPSTNPYMTYTMHQHPSIVSDLDVLGYSSIAIHPFYAQEWKRSTVYPQFGFSNFISGETFSDDYLIDQNMDLFDIVDGDILPFGNDLEYLRGFITDAECYRKVLEVTAEEESDKNFIFLVTVQNHGGYNRLGGSECEQLTESSAINEYFYLEQISDKSFIDFLNQLEDKNEKIVVLMFGDHQPSFGDHQPYIDKEQLLKSRYFSDEKAYAEDYVVPYIFWSNYDVEWNTPDFVSLNYLSAVLKQNCKLPLTQFDQFRLECMEEYPVITYHFCIDANGEYYSWRETPKDEILQEYAIIQYDRLNN